MRRSGLARMEMKAITAPAKAPEMLTPRARRAVMANANGSATAIVSHLPEFSSSGPRNQSASTSNPAAHASAIASAAVDGFLAGLGNSLQSGFICVGPALALSVIFGL